MPYEHNPQSDDVLEDTIETFLHLTGGAGEGATGDTDLFREILITVSKFIGERPDRGEVKLINSALKELRYGFKIFRDYTERRKVSIFGSARIKPNDDAYVACREFARKMAEVGWMAITGAGPGIMQAGIEGAGRENSFGVNIRLPFEQHANKTIHRDAKLINFKYFFTRKVMFVKEASALVLLPGGFGTLDEGFETMTLLQTGKSNPIPLVLLDTAESDYWEMWRLFIRKELLGRGLIAHEDQSLYFITKDAEEAVNHILHFYSNYHSARYVRDRLVIRLQHSPTGELIEELNDTFADICAEGGFCATGPLPDELVNEPEAVLRLPRLVFPFSRMSFGRLRQLVDRLNDQPANAGGKSVSTR